MERQSWLAVSHRHALRFFFEHLRDLDDDGAAPETELLYNASVLAHFATTSTATPEFPATPSSLSTVFDLFVLDSNRPADPDIMEAAAGQCLLLTGFFGAQQRRRHNLDWYASLGASFYGQAADVGRDPARAAMMRAMAARFPFWRQQQARLAQELHDLPRLVRSGPSVDRRAT
jgi:hypothetical protein